MPVVFDASFLMALLDPKLKGTGDIDARVDFLVRSLDKARNKIIVPTPALSEVLIGAGDASPKYLEIINKSARFKIVPFGTRAAVEAAAAHRAALRTGDKKEGSTSAWGKVKFDRQIVAIAKVEGADVIYSNDVDIERFSARDNLEVIKLEQLPLPPEKQQGELSLSVAPEDEETLLHRVLDSDPDSPTS
jgi:predicted nucleic acid-binding protein